MKVDVLLDKYLLLPHEIHALREREVKSSGPLDPLHRRRHRTLAVVPQEYLPFGVGCQRRQP